MANLRVESSKVLGAVEQKNQELTAKLTTEERAPKSAKASLKNAQVEDQRKKHYHIEIELATTKQWVLKLEQAKVVARTVKEDMEALKQAFYDLRVQETEVRLAEELVEVCRDYCKKVWMEALNLAGIPAASE